MVVEHLFLNIIPKSFITGTGRKRWCDWGMSLSFELIGDHVLVWYFPFIQNFIYHLDIYDEDFNILDSNRVCIVDCIFFLLNTLRVYTYTMKEHSHIAKIILVSIWFWMVVTFHHCPRSYSVGLAPTGEDPNTNPKIYKSPFKIMLKMNWCARFVLRNQVNHIRFWTIFQPNHMTCQISTQCR